MRAATGYLAAALITASWSGTTVYGQSRCTVPQWADIVASVGNTPASLAYDVSALDKEAREKFDLAIGDWSACTEDKEATEDTEAWSGTRMPNLSSSTDRRLRVLDHSTWHQVRT